MTAARATDDATSPERAVVLKLSYDGANFSGMVPQENGRTVGGELLGAISVVDPRVTALRVASRTDAGVHARGQLVAFDTTRSIDPRGWAHAITRELPREIAVAGAWQAARGFDPRNHVTRKRYRYTILAGEARDPMLEGRAWRVGDRLNLSAARAEARELLGEHDFAAFRSKTDERKNTVRRILRAELARSEERDDIVTFDVVGNAFLHRMVRIIVGTLVDVARGRRPPGTVRRALVQKSREDLGMTAPADGLCLEEIALDVALDPGWP